MRCYIRYVFKDNPTLIIVTVSFYFMVVLLDILSELCIFHFPSVLEPFRWGGMKLQIPVTKHSHDIKMRLEFHLFIWLSNSTYSVHTSFPNFTIYIQQKKFYTRGVFGKILS